MDREQLPNSITFSNSIQGNEPSKEKGTSKMTSPNVVARLMGLAELPSPQVIHRPQNTPAVNNRQKTSRRRSQRDDEAWSYQRSYVEQPQFKDVFEDTTKKSGYTKNASVELLQQSDYLFPEHLRMHISPSSFTYDQIAILKPLNSQKQKTKARGWKAEMESPVKDDFQRHTYSSHGSQSLVKSSTISMDRKGESDILPKTIVILKPNYAKVQSASNSFSSPDSSNSNFSDYSNHKQYPNTLKSEYYFRNMEIRKDVDFTKHRSRKATKPIKKTTREMRDTSSCMMNNRDTANKLNEKGGEDFGLLMDSISSSVRGSPDMRDLCDFSGNVSASESEEMSLTSYGMRESFVTSEAKKRLLERLKKAQKNKDIRVNNKESMLREMYQDVGVDSKKITLGEMLSTPDANIRNLEAKMSRLSSRDGLNESHSKLTSSSRSLRPLSIRSEKQNADGEHRVDDKLLMPKEATHQNQRKVANRNCKKKKNSSSKNSMSSKRNSQSDRLRYTYNSDSLLKSCSNQDQMEINLNKKDSTDEQVVIQTPNGVASVVTAANIQDGSRTLSLVSSDEFSPKISLCMEKYNNSFVGNQEDTTPQRTKVEAESTESSKEADNLSPVSVLEVTIREDDVLPCHGSFEQVSADLRELQKQLQLLKRESKSFTGDPTLNNDCDAQQGPVTSFEDVGIHTRECWESSYIIDVLTESGFHNSDTDTFTSTCYYPDCPLGPWVFDNLENKLYGKATGLKHERRLLFDRINSALSEIPKTFMEPCPWVRPTTVGTGFKEQKCEITDELHELLRGQEKEAYEVVLEKLLDKEMNWVGSRDFVDAIGTEIEKLLTEELLTEIVNEVEFLN
ncbi:hypothetical protein POM88_003202 [Heracleum sosnowskyi]|uniref:DUF4378 domain-containing protein n=1 Tax=Heracleum sosnowskyi TaxID=360622 RepID=A0AAD8JFW7_9APIA|nr:hypothetical protein POM88_003202 [Heracleum sosnowskyi]